MELAQTKKLANHIFRLLKVTEITIPIGRTNKGNLGIKLTQNNDDYEIMLDAVPLSTKDFLEDDNNIELKKMLDKYLFDAHFKWTGVMQPQAQGDVERYNEAKADGTLNEKYPIIAKIEAKKQRGRPKGSKAKVK